MKFKIKGLTTREVLLTKTEAQQIRELIHSRKREGWYYGNKQQYVIREMHIEQKLDNLTYKRRGDCEISG